MRKRKNTSTAIRCYKYRCYPVRDIPGPFWECGRLQQKLWSVLAVLRADTFTAGEWTADMWSKWREGSVAQGKASGLNWEVWPDVITRFEAAMKSAQETRAHGAELENLRVPHRWTGGGADIGVLRGRGWRCVIDDGGLLQFGLSPVDIASFRMVMHRPLPPKAKMKWAALCGRKVPLRGWEWHIVFSLELERPEIRQPRGACELRIGWSRVAGGVLVASARDAASGAVRNLVLPVDAMGNKADRRNRKPIMGYRDLAALSERIKDAEGIERMELRTLHRQIWERWTRRKRDLYRNFAAWLTKEYAEIRWNPLKVKELAEQQAKALRLHAADRLRQWASPGDLQLMIKQSADWRRCVLAELPQAEAVSGREHSLRNFAGLGKAEVVESAGK